MKINAENLARLCRLSPSTIAMARRRGLINCDENKLYDLADPDVRAYLFAHGAQLPSTSSPASRESSHDFEAVTGLPESVADMTLHQFVVSGAASRHGKIGGQYARIYSTLLTTQKNELAARERRQKLISRELTEKHITAFLDDLGRRMNATTEGLTVDMIQAAQADAGKARLSIPEKMREHISASIKATKKDVIKNLLREVEKS